MWNILGASHLTRQQNNYSNTISTHALNLRLLLQKHEKKNAINKNRI